MGFRYEKMKHTGKSATSAHTDPSFPWSWAALGATFFQKSRTVFFVGAGPD